MFKFICFECGTNYSSSENTPPPGIHWNDGHVCSPILVNDAFKKGISDLKNRINNLEQETNIHFKRVK